MVVVDPVEFCCWFQSTFPRGERRLLNEVTEDRKVFQSTFPRGERPYMTGDQVTHNGVSIHVPTRGTTDIPCAIIIARDFVSIHVPTRGTTTSDKLHKLG